MWQWFSVVEYFPTTIVSCGSEFSLQQPAPSRDSNKEKKKLNCLPQHKTGFKVWLRLDAVIEDNLIFVCVCVYCTSARSLREFFFCFFHSMTERKLPFEWKPIWCDSVVSHDSILQCFNVSMTFSLLAFGLFVCWKSNFCLNVCFG